MESFKHENFAEQEEKKPSIPQLGLIFSVCLILFIFVGSRLQRYHFHTGVLATEFLIIMLPPLLLLYLKHYKISQVMRLNKLAKNFFFDIPVLMLLAMPIVAAINFVNLLLINYFLGKPHVNQPPISDTFAMMLIDILVIAGSASLCEETLFRGFVQRGFEKFGTKASLILASTLFAFMHISIEKLVGTFLLGLLIGFIVYRTNSLYAGMIAHFANNATAVLLSFMFSSIKGNSTPKTDATPTSLNLLPLFQTQKTVLLIFLLFSASILLIFISAFMGRFRRFVRRTRETACFVESTQSGLDKYSYLSFLPAFIIIIFLFSVQILNFKGIQVELIDTTLELLKLSK